MWEHELAYPILRLLVVILINAIAIWAMFANRNGIWVIAILTSLFIVFGTPYKLV